MFYRLSERFQTYNAGSCEKLRSCTLVKSKIQPRLFLAYKRKKKHTFSRLQRRTILLACF